MVGALFHVLQNRFKIEEVVYLMQQAHSKCVGDCTMRYMSAWYLAEELLEFRSFVQKTEYCELFHQAEIAWLFRESLTSQTSWTVYVNRGDIPH